MEAVEVTRPRTSGATAMKRAVASFVIAVLVFIAYLGVYYNDILWYDDCDYVLRNPVVQQGMTAKNITGAFSGTHSANWHPLTWLSHMVDWKLYGNRPAGHHMTSVAFHAANAVLLFLVLAYMTGYTGRSAVVALFFALHPLHVESVAWIAERKDVLCTFFWFLTIFCYAWHVRKPSWKRFGWVMTGFACALMSKPMAVTLPFTLLLLDYWPLRRVAVKNGAERHRLSAWKGLVAEKWPLYVMAVISCWVTFYAQRTGHAVASLEAVPLWARTGNAAMSYWRYIIKMFWPDPLAVYYHHESSHLVFPFALLLALLLLLATAGFWLVRKKMPYGLTGWLWYLGTLVPVIGIVQVGPQAMADRYTYVPLTGLFIMLVWSVGDWVRGRERIRRVVLAAAVAAVAAMAVKSVVQLGVWQNDIALFRHVLEKDPRGTPSNMVMSWFYHVRGQPREARKYFERAQFFRVAGYRGSAFSDFCLLQEKDSLAARTSFEREVSMAPDRYPVLKETAEFNSAAGRPADAETYYRRLLAIAPDSIHVRVALGQALSEQNKLAEAEREYREVLARDAGNVEAYNRLGVVLTGRQMFDAAIAAFRRSLEIKPGQSLPHANIGRVFLLRKSFPDAVMELSEAVRLDPAEAGTHMDLGTALFALGDYKQARMHYRRAIELNPRFEEAKKSLKMLEERLLLKPEPPK